MRMGDWLLRNILSLSALFLGTVPGLLGGGQTWAETNSLPAVGTAQHVVVVVWDGMRPDFVTPQHTPTLCRLASEGVFFKRHHPVYISSTEVNGTALATGMYPNHSGVIANREYLPEINWLDSSATESVDTIRKSDWLTTGHYLQVLTLAETLQQAGHRTAVAGTKPVALLQDRLNQRSAPAAKDSVILYNGHSIPSAALAGVVRVNEKDFPAAATPNLERDTWTAKGLTRSLWKKGVPKFSLLWMSEPDASQHATMPGSDASLDALANNDRILDSVLQALEEKGVRNQTDVLLVSDHAFSSIQRGVDVAEALKRAHFKAARKFDDPEPGDVLVVGLGGSVLLYVIGHDEAITRRLVQFLQGTDFAGVIFSRLQLPGTFSLQQARLDSAKNQPDVVVALRWHPGENDFGAPGMLVADSGKKGTATHGSLSHYDMHNILVASGPDFRRGWLDELPSGNADVAPTVLWILGVKPAATLDGRILSEALVAGGPPTVEPKTFTIQTQAELGLWRWHQQLTFTTLGEQIYFDEGNGQCRLE